MTWLTLEEALIATQRAVGDVSGINQAPDYPPSQPSEFPFVATVVDSFTVKANTPEDCIILYTLRVEIHVAIKDTAEDIRILLLYPETISRVILQVLRDNQQAHGEIAGVFGDLGWGGVETMGFAWLIPGVKITQNLS